ncbi:hypothetical protein PAPYR_600 [Paratrimastix pyriformis]|uniref:Uncharacterized protein n=1 Tax=Paratrimastix pyriformis TaxID=342808 RepID=A0ABQ8UU10_9EUKA|nr:hypothetical protein PAPYR_600 [Paratrimastix pyriformis]
MSFQISNQVDVPKGKVTLLLATMPFFGVSGHRTLTLQTRNLHTLEAQLRAQAEATHAAQCDRQSAASTLEALKLDRDRLQEALAQCRQIITIPACLFSWLQEAEQGQMETCELTHRKEALEAALATSEAALGSANERAASLGAQLEQCRREGNRLAAELGALQTAAARTEQQLASLQRTAERQQTEAGQAAARAQSRTSHVHFARSPIGRSASRCACRAKCGVCLDPAPTATNHFHQAEQDVIELTRANASLAAAQEALTARCAELTAQHLRQVAGEATGRAEVLQGEQAQREVVSQGEAMAGLQERHAESLNQGEATTAFAMRLAAERDVDFNVIAKTKTPDRHVGTVDRTHDHRVTIASSSSSHSPASSSFRTYVPSIAACPFHAPCGAGPAARVGMAELEQRNCLLAAEQTALHSRIAELEQSLRDAQADGQHQDHETEQLRASLTNTQAALTQVRQQVGQLDVERARLQGQLRQSQALCTQRLGEAEQVREAHRLVAAERDRLSTQNSQSMMAYASLEADRNALSARVSELERELTQIRERLSRDVVRAMAAMQRP